MSVVTSTSDEVKKQAQDGWEWFLGTPLRIIIIVVVAAITLAVLRTFVRRVTTHIAEGTPWSERGVMKPLSGTPVADVLAKADPLASARRAQRARTLGSVLTSVIAIVVCSIAVFLVLDALGVNIAPFLASAGIVGVALGFGAQSLVKDFLTGTFMLLEDQYGVGDVVDAGPATGTVEAVTLRVTKLRDADGTLWYIPNGTMLRVGNKTQGWATAVVEVDVDYFADVDQVTELLRGAAASVQEDPTLAPLVLGEPTITGIEKLTADAVTLRMRVRTAPAHQWEVARALRVAARAALDAADVPLAGQRDLMATHRAESAGEEGPAADADPAHGADVDPAHSSEADPAHGSDVDPEAAGEPDPHATPVERAVEPRRGGTPPAQG